MTVLLEAGLAVSLGGPLLLVLVTRRFALNPLSLASRMLLWLLAAVAFALAARSGEAWPLRIGATTFGWLDLLSTVVAIIAMLAGAIAWPPLMTKLGVKGSMGSDLQKKIYSLSAPYRLFLVTTAAVAEEMLYRGYAIGIGQEVWGSLTVALVVSLLVFVGAHVTHGAKALVTVFWISLLMSLLFVITNSLWACIVAHFVVDAFGILLVPWLMARQRAHGARKSPEENGARPDLAINAPTSAPPSGSPPAPR